MWSEFACARSEHPSGRFIKRQIETNAEMYNPQTAKEAKDYMNYTYIAMIVLGALMALGALPSILAGLTSFGFGFFMGLGIGVLIWGLVLLAVGIFGVYTALTTIKPKVIDKIDQGKYQEAYTVSSSTMTLIIAFITGIIPGILLILANQKLSQVTGPAAPPPPPV